MISTWRTLVIAAFLLSAPLARGQEPIDVDKVEALVKKLGSASFAQREIARKELEALDTSALDALRRAEKTVDLETRRRLTAVINLLDERRISELVLAPKLIHLKLDGVSVQKGIDELARLSGYPIHFLGGPLKIPDKKITLDSGKVSYWQALDLFCEQAGLIERIQLEEGYNQPSFIRSRMRGFTPLAKPAGPLLLIPGTSKKSHIHYAGSLKIEVRPVRDAKTNELVLTFIVSAEPRLLDCGVVGLAMLDKIADQDGRKLTIVPPPAETAEQAQRRMLDSTPYPPLLPGRHAQIRVKAGDVKQLKELLGKLTLVAHVPNQELARLPNILTAARKSVKSVDASGRGMLMIHDVRTLPKSSTVEVSLSLLKLAPDQYGSPVIIKDNRVIIRGRYDSPGLVLGANGVTIHGNGAAATKELPDLIDAKGKKFKTFGTRSDDTNFVDGERRNMQVLYTAEPGQAEPADLVLYGVRTYAMLVPFRFEDMPLP